ncbi:unnamed protein product [Allacma fusca]|uniref:RING-type E3 ubiquitin transferase n=1 Tax=Allacma fusca TaxID=39272 RepID=A0A8J2LDW4_9HEXA|nr:unnamed protein product [Allacma fusca]
MKSNTTSQAVNSSNAGTGPVTNNSGQVGSSKTWELSDYELHRTPQEALTDGSEIAVSPRALHSELMCPICLDMLHQTMTTKECLHRFCADCIITALRSGNKECPTCRKKLVSKRSLRPDPNFDMLISKIYPSRDEYEAQQQKAMARLSKTHNLVSLTSSIEEGMKAQSQQRKALKPTGKTVANSSINEAPEGVAATADGNASAPVGGIIHPPTAGGNLNPPHSPLVNGQAPCNPHPSASTLLAPTAGVPSSSNPSHLGPSPAKVSRTDSAGGDSSNTSGFSEEVTEVELVFKPHPDMLGSSPQGNQYQTRFIKTTANASVEHLAKYLGMRLALDSQESGGSSSTLHNCTIYVNNTGSSYVTIPQNQTLSQVCEKYWRFNKPLEMFYSWKKM